MDAQRFVNSGVYNFMHLIRDDGPNNGRARPSKSR
jgi:hypothetical protein